MIFGPEYPFDADAHGITHVAFTVESPPTAGVEVELTMAFELGCMTDPMACVAFGFYLPPITEPKTIVAPLTGFKQADAVSPYQTLDTSVLASINFHAGDGPYDFCISEVHFLDSDGEVVSPPAP